MIEQKDGVIIIVSSVEVLAKRYSWYLWCFQAADIAIVRNISAEFVRII